MKKLLSIAKLSSLLFICLSNSNGAESMVPALCSPVGDYESYVINTMPQIESLSKNIKQLELNCFAIRNGIAIISRMVNILEMDRSPKINRTEINRLTERLKSITDQSGASKDVITMFENTKSKIESMIKETEDIYSQDDLNGLIEQLGIQTSYLYEFLEQHEEYIVISQYHLNNLKRGLEITISEEDEASYESCKRCFQVADSEMIDHVILPANFKGMPFYIAQQLYDSYQTTSFDISALNSYSMLEFIDATKQGLINPLWILVTESMSIENRKIFADAVEEGIFCNTVNLRYVSIEGDDFLTNKLSLKFMPKIEKAFFQLSESQKEAFLSNGPSLGLLQIPDLKVAFCGYMSYSSFDKTELQTAVAEQQKKARVLESDV